MKNSYTNFSIATSLFPDLVEALDPVGSGSVPDILPPSMVDAFTDLVMITVSVVPAGIRIDPLLQTGILPACLRISPMIFMEKPLSFVSPSLYGFLNTVRSSFAVGLWYRNPQNEKPPKREAQGFQLQSLASWFPFTGWLWHLVDQAAETVNGPVPSRLSS